MEKRISETKFLVCKDLPYFLADIPEFLNVQILEAFIEKTKNRKLENFNLPPSTPLYYSINTTIENYGYEIFKNLYKDTTNKAISFYKKTNTEHIMYHSHNYGLWIIVLKDNQLIFAYPKMCTIYEVDAC